MFRQFTVLALVLVAFAASAQASTIAHWTGDNTAADSSGNGHHGTLVGGTTYGTGVYGQAFKFDGANDYVTIPGNFPVDGALQPATISVAMWVNVVSGGGLQLIADGSHGGVGGNNGGWALQVSSTDKVDFAYGYGNQTFPHISSTTDIADGTFHHVLAMMNGTHLRIFVDGIEDATPVAYPATETPLASTANFGNVRLGSHYSISTRALEGLIDDVRIFSNELPPAQIEAVLAGVPEPSTLILAVLGLLSLGVTRRRRRR